MSRKLIEEAEKYFEDFLSNVEDTDFSSVDGEKSDASLTLIGGANSAVTSMFSSKAHDGGHCSEPTILAPEMDGLVLPWLQWDPITDASYVSNKTNDLLPDSSNALQNSQDVTIAGSRDSIVTSHGSCSPSHGVSSTTSRTVGQLIKDDEKSQKNLHSFCLNDYMKIQEAEDALFLKFRERNRIEYGSLLLCSKFIP